MDVLFKSIDVRDLLSTPDVDDPTTPLSAPDLRLLIDRLQVHSLHIKSKVHTQILTHHADFSALFARAVDAVHNSAILSDDVHDLLSLLSDRPLDAHIKSVINEIVDKRQEVKEKRELLEIVGSVLELSDGLAGILEDVKNGVKLVEAAEKLRDLKGVLNISGSDDGLVVVAEDDEPLVYGLLKREWAHCFEERNWISVCRYKAFF